MPLESCVICLDNSEWMRNSDYAPTRLSSQYDLVSMLVSAKLRDNPESTVGLLTTAGSNGIDVLASPTLDQGKLLSALHGIRLAGKCKLKAGVQVAMLALKHRQNKKGSQRVVLVVGSPVEYDEKALVKIGKQMKKNNVALDIIMMGENELNDEKLQKFVEAANKNDNSRIVTVPTGMRAADVVRQSVLVRNNVGGSGVAGTAGSSGGAFEEYGGVDPSLDPELAMALRVSMAEAREQAESQGAAAPASGLGTQATSAGDAAPPAPTSVPMADDDDMSEEDMLLQQALAMSMAAAQGDSGEAGQPAPTSSPSATTAPVSAADAVSESPSDFSGSATSDTGAFDDPSFVNNLLSSLPGVDVNDPAIQAALAQMASDNDGDKKNEEDKDKDEN